MGCRQVHLWNSQSWTLKDEFGLWSLEEVQVSSVQILFVLLPFSKFNRVLHFFPIVKFDILFNLVMHACIYVCMYVIGWGSWLCFWARKLCRIQWRSQWGGGFAVCQSCYWCKKISSCLEWNIVYTSLMGYSYSNSQSCLFLKSIMMNSTWKIRLDFFYVVCNCRAWWPEESPCSRWWHC